MSNRGSARHGCLFDYFHTRRHRQRLSHTPGGHIALLAPTAYSEYNGPPIMITVTSGPGTVGNINDADQA